MMNLSYTAEDLSAMASEAAEREEIIKLDNEMRASDEFFITQENLAKVVRGEISIFKSE